MVIVFVRGHSWTLGHQELWLWQEPGSMHKGRSLVQEDFYLLILTTEQGLRGTC